FGPMSALGQKRPIALLASNFRFSRESRCRPLHISAHILLVGALGDVAAPLIAGLTAKREILACRRHARLTVEVIRPITKIIAMPWAFRLERWQAESLPNCSRSLHEFALGQRDRSVGAFERRVDEHCSGFAAVARAARAVARMFARHDYEIVLRLAA